MTFGETILLCLFAEITKLLTVSLPSNLARFSPEGGPAPPGGQRVPAAVRRRPGRRPGPEPGGPGRVRQGGRLRPGLHPAGSRPEAARPQPAGDLGHEALAAVPLLAQPAPLRLQRPVALERLLPGGQRAPRRGRRGGGGDG